MTYSAVRPWSSQMYGHREAHSPGILRRISWRPPWGGERVSAQTRRCSAGAALADTLSSALEPSSQRTYRHMLSSSATRAANAVGPVNVVSPWNLHRNGPSAPRARVDIIASTRRPSNGFGAALAERLHERASAECGPARHSSVEHCGKEATS